LKELLYKTVTFYKARQKNKLTAKITYVYVLTDQHVCKTYIHIRADVLLIRLKPGQRCCFISNVYVNNILLKKPACVKEQQEERTNVKIILIKDLLIKLCLLTSPVKIL
jgi:hypothetical protein